MIFILDHIIYISHFIIHSKHREVPAFYKVKLYAHQTVSVLQSSACLCIFLLSVYHRPLFLMYHLRYCEAIYSCWDLKGLGSVYKARLRVSIIGSEALMNYRGSFFLFQCQVVWMLSQACMFEFTEYGSHGRDMIFKLDHIIYVSHFIIALIFHSPETLKILVLKGFVNIL